ncbi:MAG: hypothetical protein AAF515_00210 [Pseudomonadota bacterium]
MNRYAVVQLTLLSITVALILENLLGQVDDPSVDWSAPLTWLQGALIVVTVINIWSGFALVQSITTRAPQIVDLIYPFGLLIFLTLAANSLADGKHLRFLASIVMSGSFACWALWTESNYAELTNTPGVPKMVFYFQLGTVLVSLATCIALWAADISESVLMLVLGGLVIAHIWSAFDTLAGWRFATDGGFDVFQDAEEHAQPEEDT